MLTAEQQARVFIGRLLKAAGWALQDFKAADVHAARGVALREFELISGHGTADYLLYVDGKACGVIEAKKQGATVTDVEVAFPQALISQGLEWHRIVAAGERRCPIVREVEAEVGANLRRPRVLRDAGLACASDAA